MISTRNNIQTTVNKLSYCCSYIKQKRYSARQLKQYSHGSCFMEQPNTVDVSNGPTVFNDTNHVVVSKFSFYMFTNESNTVRTYAANPAVDTDTNDNHFA